MRRYIYKTTRQSAQVFPRVPLVPKNGLNSMASPPHRYYHARRALPRKELQRPLRYSCPSAETYAGR